MSAVTVEINGQVDARGVRCLESLVGDRQIKTAWYGEELQSTNTRAVDDLRRGVIDGQHLPRIYLTDLQTGGRGRQGRTWISDKQNLAFSIAFPIAPSLASNLGLQSIAVGVAIAEAIEHEFAPIKTKLKWPNDVWIDGGKFGGILIERVSSVADCMVVGVGLNVSSAPPAEEISHGAAAKSLANCLGRMVSKWEVLDAVARRLIDIQVDLEQDAQSVIQSFRQRCLLTNKTISYQHDGTKQSGLCEGIDDSGGLLVQQGAEIRTITSGEATLVRVQA
ncbi:Bifunctional ligase/repressor BirA [Rubripirellula obstinata]|uniref:biotin--[biotin carboxyl-carrier protein] ligase n=1 Tax=Rubripirellula obstinata TaxID=406547 RepID=A0A5B1CJA4_9BACT|nr:Bifunctional ligase/repressor BirA [Rubripirellula obstinata]